MINSNDKMYSIEHNEIKINKQIIKYSDWISIMDSLNSLCKKYDVIHIDFDKSVFAPVSGLMKMVYDCAEKDKHFIIRGSKELIDFVRSLLSSSNTRVIGKFTFSEKY